MKRKQIEIGSIVLNWLFFFFFALRSTTVEKIYATLLLVTFITINDNKILAKLPFIKQLQIFFVA
jgi:hypothetical protein